MIIKHNAKEGTIDKLQSLKGKVKMQVHQDINSFFDGLKKRRKCRKNQFEEDSFRKNAQSKSNIPHEALVLLNFLPTKLRKKRKI